MVRKGKWGGADGEDLEEVFREEAHFKGDH